MAGIGIDALAAIGLFVAAAPALAKPATLNGPVADEPLTLRQLQTFDERLTTIGYRLQTRAGDLCRVRRPLPGIVVQDISQYESRDQAAARREFGLEDYPAVLAVAVDSPAYAAGVRGGDMIVAIDGEPVEPVSRPAASSVRRVTAINAMIDAATTDGILMLALKRSNAIREVRIVLEQGCPTRFQTAVTGSLDAVADGDTVEVDIGAMRFAGDDAAIAAVAAHELAHNILRHRERLDAARVRNARGTRGARLTRITEDEADRLSVYLLDRAGYPPVAAVSFWTRLRMAPGRRPLPQHAHGDPTARIAVLNTEIARIRAMKAAGEVPRPTFLMSEILPVLR